MKRTWPDWATTGLYGVGVALSIFSMAQPLSANSNVARGGACCYFSWECTSGGGDECWLAWTYYCDYATDCGYPGSGAGQCKCVP